MEAVSEPGAPVDVGDLELVRGASPRLSERGEEDNLVTGKEMESKETEHKDSEAASAPSPVSPLNPSTSQSSFSTEETIGTVLVQGGEPGSPSESEKEATEVKTEEEFKLNEDSVAEQDKSLMESPAEPGVSEDTNMDKTSDHKEITNADGDTKEDVDTQQEKDSHGSKLRVSTADDLDEMMDIGTVDQVEQEAQMKEEEESSLMDVDSSRSPDRNSNTGKAKQRFCFSMNLSQSFVLMQRNIFNQREFVGAKKRLRCSCRKRGCFWNLWSIYYKSMVIYHVLYRADYIIHPTLILLET